MYQFIGSAVIVANSAYITYLEQKKESYLWHKAINLVEYNLEINFRGNNV